MTKSKTPQGNEKSIKIMKHFIVVAEEYVVEYYNKGYVIEAGMTWSGSFYVGMALYE